MLPEFRQGKLIAASGWFGRLQEGDYVILRHDGLEKIKKIDKLSSNKIYIIGINDAMSTDSRHFGWLDKSHVIAKVLF